MNSMTPFLEKFNKTIESAEDLIFITRSQRLQEQALSELHDLYSEAASEKEIAIKNGNEKYANILLGCECAISAIGSAITMWLLLKSDDPEKAWDRLIDAQTSSLNAMRASEAFQHVGSFYAYLRTIEDYVFPSQTFISSGLNIEEQICTICNEDYEDCEHLVNLPYMGEFCFIKPGKITPDHVSIVKNPADKRCRVTSFDDGDYSINKMTWKKTLRDNKDDEEGNNMNAIIF